MWRVQDPQGSSLQLALAGHETRHAEMIVNFRYCVSTRMTFYSPKVCFELLANCHSLEGLIDPADFFGLREKVKFKATSDSFFFISDHSALAITA